MNSLAHPPATLEGWYASHHILAIPRDVRPSSSDVAAARGTLADIARGADGSWSLVVPLTGSAADVMIVHLRPTLEELAAAEQRVKSDPFLGRLRPVYDFLSVTEAGLYHLTAQLARDAADRGGEVGDPDFERELAERSAREAGTEHVRRRLYPQPPPEMPYVCFYPMSKRRTPDQNWYSLTLEERSRLMYAHGLTGRRYAGRVMQIITGATGLDAWEWGVTLFAKDPLDFKKLVTEMRFDEASARYAEFGAFYVGRIAEPGQWPPESTGSGR